MIMGITWGKLRPGSCAEFEHAYNTTVAAKGNNIQGLRGRWLLQDTQDKETGFAVSLWDNASAMHAYKHSELYLKEFAPILQPFFDGEYKTSQGDVQYMQ